MRLKIEVKLPLFASCCREWLITTKHLNTGKHTSFRPIRISYTPDSIMAALAITHMHAHNSLYPACNNTAALATRFIQTMIEYLPSNSLYQTTEIICIHVLINTHCAVIST